MHKATYCTHLLWALALAPSIGTAGEDPQGVGASRGSAFIHQDHSGVVDRLIQDEQQRYAREHAKPEPEPEPSETEDEGEVADAAESGFSLHSGPVPYFTPQRRPEPYYVGLFGRSGHYRVEIYYQGSVMDYAVGDRIPGGYRLSGVRSQYVTVTKRKGGGDEVKHLYLTSRAAVDRKEAALKDTGDRGVNDLPPGLLR